MKRLMKSKKGFTLVEITLAVVILVILASVALLSVSDYVTKAHNAASSLEKHNDSISVLVSSVDAEGSV